LIANPAGDQTRFLPMTESSKTASAAAQSVLLPQGDHAGKSGLPLGGRPFTLIGSRNRAHLHLLSTTISRSHACIISSKSGMYVRDLASRTGVLVNGRKVKEMDLQDGDMLEVGSFKFRFQEPLGAIHLATTPRPPLAMLEVAGGKLMPLDDRAILIGRRPNCEILLDAATVSSTHAIIFECDGQRYIRDLGSRTGTHINGELVHQQILHSGDQIRIGDASFRYVSSDAPSDELEEDSNTAELAADLIEEDELAPMPVRVGHEQEALAHATETDDLAPLHADHPERPADPIIAERTEHESIPLASEEDRATDAPGLHVERAVPPAQPEPAPAANGEFVVADDASEAEWLPIDFAEVDQAVTDLAAPAAEQGLTSPADVLEEEQLGLEMWHPATDAPLDITTSQVAHEPTHESAHESAHESTVPVAPEAVPAEARVIPVPKAESLPVEETPAAIQGEPIAIEPAVAGTESIELSPAEVAAVSGVDVPSTTEVEDVPGEYPTSPIGEVEAPAPVAETEPAVIGEVVAADALAPAHAEPQSVPLAELVIEPAEVSAPAILPPTVAPESAPAAGERVTAVELGSEFDVVPSPVSQEQHDEIVVPALAVTSPVRPFEEVLRSIEPAVPLSVEAVDLTTVTFDAQPSASEATETLAQPQPESSATPQPLLDLTAAVPHEEIALAALSAPNETTVDEWVETAADEDAGTAADPATSDKKARKPRTPRKKPTTPRRISRRKKGEEVQAAIAAADEPQNLASVPEAATEELASAAVSPELSAGSSDIDQPNISEATEPVEQPADVEAILPMASAAGLSLKATEDLPERAEHESSELATIAEMPVAEPLFNLASADVKRVEAAQVAAQSEPLAQESEPIIAQAAAEELATDAFYSGPADEAPLVSVDAHEPPLGTDPAMTGVTAQVPEDSEPEILSFEAAATTPEAKEVMAAWHGTESAPSTSDAIPALPAPATLTSDMTAVEPMVVEPSAMLLDKTVPDAGVETIENTEPTVESALDLEPSLAQVSGPSSTPDLIEVDTSLTDTAFGRAVSDFTGSGLGPLVEETSPSPHPAIGIPDPSDSFDNVLEDLPEFAMPAFSNGDRADFLDTEFLGADIFGAQIDSGDLEAANLSADLPGEVPTPPQTLTLGEISDQPATVDSTAHAADVTLTTAHDIESPTAQTADDEEFIAIGEDALIEPLEFDEQLADEMPAIDLFADSEIEAQPEPIVAEQPPDVVAKETPVPAPVVAEAATPTPPHIVAETPAPAPAPAQQPVKPPPLNPYFGMERDSGSFLGGMPLSFTAPLREPPRAPAARPENDRLPPPRLAPASAPETASTPRSPFALISPVAPIQGLAPVPAFAPFQSPAARSEPAPAQPQPPADETAAEEPYPAAEALAKDDELISELLADQSAAGRETQAGPAVLEDPDDILFQPEDPIELFDGAGDKLDELPDVLDAIDDLEGSLAGTESADVVEPAKGKLEAAAPTAAAEPAKAAAAPMTAAPVPSSTEAKASTPATSPATPPAAAGSPKPSAPPLFAAFSSMTSIAPPLQSLTGAPAPAKAAAAPAAPAAPVTVPPFAGSRPNARGSANPFAGMATPPPRLNTTDIFSQTTFPPPDEAMFRPQPIDIPPMKVRTPGVDPSATPKRREPREQPGPRPGQDAATPPQGQPGAQPPRKTAAPAPAKKESPPKKKWWQSIRLLLPLMLLVMSAAVVAIVRLFPPRTLVQGTMEIKGLDQLNPIQRKDQVRNIRELLGKPDLRNTAVGSLATQGISPGFTQDPIAMGILSDPDNSPLDRNLLVFKRVSTDPANDQKRMQALLLAVYSESKTPADGARAAGEAKVKASQDKLTSLQAEYDADQSALQKLTDSLRVATGASAREVLQNPAAAIATLQRQHDQLGSALADTNGKVRSAREVLNRAQSATVALPGTVADPQLAGMQQNLNSLKARLVSANVALGPALDKAAHEFGDSLQSLDQDLVLVALSARNNVASSYAAHARQATVEMHDLLSRQKQNRDDLALLRGQFADRREAYLMQVWAGDETLKGLLGERDAQARRYRTAFDVANAEEGAAARTEVSRMDQKIDARRRELATGGQLADSVSQRLQQAIDQLLDDQHDNDRRMALDLALLEVPPAKDLPASEQSSMASVGERVAAVQAAREQYAAASNSAKAQDSDGQARVVQEDIAEQQARMDAYQQQVQVDPPVLLKARQSLALAQNDEAKAQLAYADNLDLLASARQLNDAQARVAQSRAAVAMARTDLETVRTQAGNFVQVQPPDDAASQVIYEPDQRHWYLIGALAGLAALFAGPIWMGLKESHPRAPFAMIVNEGEEGDADLEEFHEINAIEDEGHAAAV
jgi:pSer/pThr/pTyr-binding forkhead associated (FHA) protein